MTAVIRKNPELVAIIKRLNPGWLAQWSASGHVRIYRPDGTFGTAASATPSDHRWRQNLEAKLVRLGALPARERHAGPRYRRVRIEDVAFSGAEAYACVAGRRNGTVAPADDTQRLLPRFR